MFVVAHNREQIASGPSSRCDSTESVMCRTAQSVAGDILKPYSNDFYSRLSSGGVEWWEKCELNPGCRRKAAQSPRHDIIGHGMSSVCLPTEARTRTVSQLTSPGKVFETCGPRQRFRQYLDRICIPNFWGRSHPLPQSRKLHLAAILSLIRYR